MGEEFGRFAGGEAQCLGAEFGELSTAAQASERQLGVFAGGDDEVHLGGQMLEQEGEGLVNRWRFDEVVVVEDEDEVVGDGGDVVEQGGEHCFGGWGLRGLEQAQDGVPHFGRDGLQGGDEVGEEAGGVVVVFVER